MSPRRAAALCFAVAALALAVVVGSLGVAPAGGAGGEPGARALWLWAAVGAVIAVLAVLWGALSHLVLKPLAALAEEVRVLADSKGEGAIDATAFGHLQPLPDAINALARSLAETRAAVDTAIAAATARAEEQKGRLEALLRELSEAVIVCNLDHQILLYNHMAVRMLGGMTQVGLGRSLFNFITREPVQHRLDWLLHELGRDGRREPTGVGIFVCASADSRVLLHGRMSLIVDDKGNIGGYVITLAEATRAIAALGKRDALLRQAIEGVRAPIANLRAAAETLAEHPGMPVEQRHAFERILVNESTTLSDRLAGLAAEQRSLIGDYGVMGDLHSTDLINCVIRRVGLSAGVELTMTGLPQWLYGDSYALMVTFSDVVQQIRQNTGVTAIDIEAHGGATGTYIDLVWAGQPLPSAVLSIWLDAPLAGELSGLTLRSVLERHQSDLWSEAHRPGHARVRVPLPRAVHAGPVAAEPIAARPEFYDFDLLGQASVSAEFGARPLRSLTYVIFDTETTGFHADRGDEVVAIGGVRIVNGRILTGETFSRFVNPGRPIPQAATQIHRISDDTVRDKPPLAVVLRQFKTFVADAVLVAHNIAFDLSFLKAKETAAGVALDNPFLDTMLLSATLYPEMGDHSLDILAERFGIRIDERHTALGDAMLTAAIFLALLDPLERRGIRTLDDASRASRVIIEMKTRQARFKAASGE